ncbi:phage holin family protein [Leekyejoonella antrihumi]|uniref:Phage holin family protein n=1 Tax=Leekyejoonella antrihumi TaxID=1660198 RepID=A0A563E6Q2_9MICO|nr:phage holin family protein [Leekyejoonella antrihumi]TWP37943.1 phage holin family protein [Leekyejoonella antrihumi]
MKAFAIKTGINAVALWVAAIVLQGITLTESGATTSSKVLTIIVIAIIFGLINAIVRPIVKLFSLPFLIVTLGLFTFVINAIMLELLSWLSGKLNLAFHVDHFFWSAVLGALIVSFVSLILHILIPEKQRPRR